MKKSNKYKIFALAVGLGISAVACSPDDFGDMNINPNNPAAANTAGILTGALRNVGAMATDMVPALYTQQFGDITYIEESRYKTINFSYNGYYAGGPLNSYKTIIDLNTAEATKTTAAANGSNANQIAVSRILKAYTFLWLTDRWGDIPYSQALQGSSNFSPGFDTQQAIYTDLFKELKEAQAQFDGGKAVVGDILLSGSATRWKKFANSLRMIMALRLSKVDPAKGKAEFAAALADGVLASNADNVKYTYLTESNNEHPLYNNYIVTNRKDYALSDVFVNKLLATNDPRIAGMADKNINGVYSGVPYGVFPAAAKAQDVSLAATAIRQQNSSVNVVTYAQILFSQAEAAKLGWITGDVKTLYEAAVKASIQQWLGTAATDAVVTTYLAQDAVKYDDAKAYELIATQKWIALFYQGNEAWAEWRRTGYPVLTPAAKPLNPSGQIPRRMAYPVTETTLNKVNYDKVVASQGPDTQDTRVWWDKK
ncbi:SusD/RagB family nutrient-binding outer membrane lipoprotein [Arcicella lustrica]|uniref:SusD/RagB family nutrient-binding outer membrane lipoprotein n=1 Tax=Arcicella lustrica TaxID=2984196 RepID=A0ABU5SCE6_9BACT|nr:SusD/RagB family nutrient-binding outer membrane lipoprotein [Arcicella sp. DC25W]MEA5424969.1 SusD/RagB family nutrient-binding outer membrane lipoprotein [Arcicella sp. DC25W]